MQKIYNFLFHFHFFEIKSYFSIDKISVKDSNFQLHRSMENERADYIFSDNLPRNKPR